MRHVPSSDTAHAGVLAFEEALKPTAADYDRGRWLYVPAHYSEYRYILGTRGTHPLVCIGITPSNMSILKTGKAKALRLSTLESLCRELECQPGDILEYTP